jgi:hypothetical protein
MACAAALAFPAAAAGAAVPAPVWSAATPAFVDGSQLGHGHVLMSYAWSVAGSVCSVQLQRSWRRGPFRSIPADGMTGTTYREPLFFTPAYRVWARDCDGGVSPWSLDRWGPIHRLQEDDASLTYTRGWHRRSSPDDSGHHARFTTRTGAAFALTLPPNTTDWVLALVVTTGPRRGSIVETTACGSSFTVDLYAPVRRARVVKAVPDGCPSSPITFTAVTTHDRPLVNVDAVLRVP